VGARFSAPVQTGSDTHSLLYSGYRVFSGVKVRPGRDADPSPPSSADVKNRVELTLLSLRTFVAYERVKPTYLDKDSFNRTQCCVMSTVVVCEMKLQIR